MYFFRAFFCVAAMLAVLGVSHSFAEGRVAVVKSAPQKAADCALKETASLNVNFNKTVLDIGQTRALVDEKVKEITELSAKSGVTTVDIYSMNYSINSNNAGQDTPVSFQVYGNISIRVEPTDKAIDYMAVLTDKGYNVNFNSNAYKQCEGGEDAYEHGD